MGLEGFGGEKRRKNLEFSSGFPQFLIRERLSMLLCRLRKVVKILALISKYLFIEKSKECFQIEFGG